MPEDFDPKDFDPKDFDPKDFDPKDFDPKDFEVIAELEALLAERHCADEHRSRCSSARMVICSRAMEISPLRERVSKLESRLEILRGHL